MRIGAKGQVTIPVEIRDRLGLHPDTEVEFDIVNGAARIRKVRRGATRGQKLVARLRDRGTVRMTTDEIIALTRGR